MSLSQLIGRFWNNITGKTDAMQKQQEFNSREAEKQRQYEAEQAQIQRGYEERMSNTAIQRQVADAKEAGVNAAMLYANSSSSGAATPVVSSARGAAASSSVGSAGTGPIGALSSLVNSAANLTRAFNHDRNSGNDVSFREVTNTVKSLDKLLK